MFKTFSRHFTTSPRKRKRKNRISQ